MVQMPYNARAVEVKIAGCPRVGFEEIAIDLLQARFWPEIRDGLSRRVNDLVAKRRISWASIVLIS